MKPITDDLFRDLMRSAERRNSKASAQIVDFSAAMARRGPPIALEMPQESGRTVSGLFCYKARLSRA